MPKFSSFQNEVPPSRINIRYVKDIGGAQEKVELPLKLLLLGEYKTEPEEDELEDRQRISLDMNNFKNVMKEMNLKLDFTVPNRLSDEGGDIKVGLEFKKTDDFSPDRIVEQVPELREMIELRRLLKDLKAKVITNRDFRRALDDLLAKGGNAERLASVRAELSRLAPLPDAAMVGIPEDEKEDDED